MKHSLSLASLSVAALITLSACGSSSGGEIAGTSGGSSAAAAPSVTAEVGSEATTDATSGASETAAAHNDADAMFAQMMIPHHQQAVEMSDMMLSKDDISPEITDLATKIKDAQGPEIETMTGWLEAWDEPMEPGGGMDGHSMGSDTGDSGSMEGMMSEDQMSELESAEGTEASRIFLESMTAHHEGAVSMAENEIENGQDPEAIELAETIVETQNAEITEMEELLAGL
ncbi:DUF305 domain-containing protein [Arthrobacter pityocampae]|uniref:DUF305 domain-containing protein n=1 Tax=Arthrobacter pityocampae TaxID=547334 RepID=A0A2S5IYC2_9MICC|nr:DUF305 domain-containing protein [Arthrobacter pityocampae]PPB49554.1 DUF305 domain-containing protein [Arthrobacter pityocampae]